MPVRATAPLPAFLGVFASICLAAPPAPVILISIDTLRADHLGVYGYRKIHTPNIDSFAQQGTQFTNIQCQAPLTLPSHTSLFTSTYPFENRIEENAERVPAGAVTLASVLRAHGFKTAAFIGSVFLESELGLDQGFDTYDSPFHFEAFSPISGSMFLGDNGRSPYTVRDTRDGALVLSAARRWLLENHDQPAFVFIHLFDMHRPYVPHPAAPPAPGISGYDTELQYVDRLLGGFKQFLIDHGWWQRSLVVLLSDHGEGLGEHGEASHGYFIYQSTLWVPLLFHWPTGSTNLPARIEQPAGLIDVAPTILDFLHIAAPPSFEGQSLLNTSQPRMVYSESVYTRDAFGWAALRGLRMGSYQYIHAPHPELYNLQTDPYERHNLFQPDSARARNARVELAKLLARYRPKQPAAPTNISPRTRKLLSSLGYLSGGPHPSLESSGPDPKDRLAEYKLYEDSQTFLASHRLEDAAATLRQIVTRDPHNLLARRDLGGTYLEQRLYGKARTCLQQLVDVAPDDYVAQFELGVTDKLLGLYPEAIRHLEVACKLDAQAAQCRHELDAVQRKIR